MDTSMMARIMKLEAENDRLKKGYTEKWLKNEILSEAHHKKVLKPFRRHEMVQRQSEIKVSPIDWPASSMACETCYRYEVFSNGKKRLIAN